MTNYERIKEMTFEEMVDFIQKAELEDIDYGLTYCDVCGGKLFDCEECLKQCLKQWLNQDSSEYSGIDWGKK